MRHAEYEIHKAVVQHLRLRSAPDVVWFHVPNSSKLGGKKVNGIPLEAIRGKAMGVRPGVSDLVLIHDGKPFALELKAPGGRPTEHQLKFLADFENAGGYSCCAEGLDRALAVLGSWGLFKGSN